MSDTGMSDTGTGDRAGSSSDPTVQEAAARRSFGPAAAISIAVGLVLGFGVWLVGLPSGGAVFGTPTDSLTVAVALFLALTGVAVAGAITRRTAWRVVDIVVASVLGVVGGLFFWAIATVWEPLTTGLKLAPPSVALLGGLWLVPGVLGGLIIRKPGAAVYVELVAAALEALLGNHWGFSTVYYGLIQGLGAEFALALLFYRSFALVPAMLSGAGAGLALGLLDTTIWYVDLTPGIKLGYVALAVLSGVLIAGGGAWALTRALARTGALAPLASGRSAERV